MPVVPNASATFALASGTTNGTITIPAGILTNDDLYVLIESADHTIGTALCDVADNDTGGNTWTNLGASSDRKLQLFWKKATSGTAGKLITVAGGVGSIAGGMSGFTGGGGGRSDYRPQLRVEHFRRLPPRRVHPGQCRFDDLFRDR